VIETLGSASVLCVDKTGTLTQNRMSVDSIVTPSGMAGAAEPALPPDALELLALAVLASETEPFDPMEKALHRHAGERAPQAVARMASTAEPGSMVAVAVAALYQGAAARAAMEKSSATATIAHASAASQQSAAPATPAATPALALLHEYALTQDIVAMAHCWQIPGHDKVLVAAKGAPESVAHLCGMPAEQTAAMLQQVERLATRGLRVLAVAYASSASTQWPSALDGFAFEWQGLVAFADPLRPEVPAAVADCHRAGMRVIMITGDYPATALSIARQAGIPSQQVVTGAELAAMDEQALRAAVGEVHVYARIKPEQKLRLVLALRDIGEVVAMTGDGINDAPALKAAHIGISMGQRGTDVAREASSLVLLEDDFGAIVQAVRMGRRIYDNLRKAMAYVIAAHLPIAGMALLPLLAGAPLALLPAHIVFLELIIDPACATVFENEPPEDDLMSRPPRPPGLALLGWDNMQLALVGGGLVLLAVAAVFFGALAAGVAEAAARGLAFVTIVLGNLGLIAVNRSRAGSLATVLRRRNSAQWWVLGGTLASLLLVFENDWLRRAFRFDMPNGASLALAALVTLAAILAAEVFKRLALPRSSS
jgi:Ca2+-transporting ATPase